MTHFQAISIPGWGECAQGYCDCDGSGPHSIRPMPQVIYERG